MKPTLVALLTLVVLTMSGCSRGSERASRLETYTEAGITFQVPRDWSVSGFSASNSPPRLAVASYPAPPHVVEGDCGGIAAVRLLPPAGALIVLIDYGANGPSFPPRPDPMTLDSGTFGDYECFGASTAFRFRVGRRDLQAHVALGPRAGEMARDRALAVLSSITIPDP